MFADDTKIWAKIHKMKDKEALQSDLDNLVAWSQKWLLALNIEQDAQLSQKDRAAGCIIVFAKSRTLELRDNDLRTL